MTINLDNGYGDFNKKSHIYDQYNGFIFSDDRFIFNKLLMRHSLYLKTSHLLGDIVECGVFRGSGMFSWLKMLDMYEAASSKKVIGFDFFNTSFLDDIDSDIDRRSMAQVFDRCNGLEEDDISQSGISKKITSAGFRDDRWELVPGDISRTSKEFVTMRPGFRISLLYLDLDIYQPTMDTLDAFWDRVVPGGIIVFDEYAYHAWTESDAVDQFVKHHEIELIKTGIGGPTAYVIKP